MKGTRIALISAFLLLLSASNSHGDTKYNVQRGDNLYSISKKFNVSVEDIMRENSLDTIALKINQSLRIPSPSSDNQNESTHAEPQRNNAKPNKNPAYHTVKRGENIYRIAKKYNLTVDTLKDINNLSSNAVKTGQKLIIAPSEPLNSGTEDDGLDTIRLAYLKKKNPQINQAKISEVQELSKTEDLNSLSLQERVILFAKKLLHLPYTFGGSGAFGIDCSGYVQKVYKAAGIQLPRSAREQYKQGELIDNKQELTKGDLVFFRTYASFPSHVGIYLGNNLFIHASTLSKKVTIDSMETPYYVKRYIGAKRFLTEKEAEMLSEPILNEN